LNVTPDHLNRHHTMEAYAEAKEAIARNQTKEEICVLNYENEYTRSFAERCSAKAVMFSSARELIDGYFLRGDKIVKSVSGQVQELLDIRKDMNLVGICNVENVMAAIAMAEGMQASRHMHAVSRASMRFMGKPPLRGSQPVHERQECGVVLFGQVIANQRAVFFGQRGKLDQQPSGQTLGHFAHQRGHLLLRDAVQIHGDFFLRNFIGRQPDGRLAHQIVAGILFFFRFRSQAGLHGHGGQ